MKIRQRNGAIVEVDDTYILLDGESLMVQPVVHGWHEAQDGPRWPGESCRTYDPASCIADDERAAEADPRNGLHTNIATPF